MSDVAFLYRNNGHWIRLLDLVDKDGAAVLGAAVTAVVRTKVGSNVVGPTWPVTLTQIGVTNDYEALVDTTPFRGLMLTQHLDVVVSVNAGGVKGEFVRDVPFKERAA
jgi:hypothetical protein